MAQFRPRPIDMDLPMLVVIKDVTEGDDESSGEEEPSLELPIMAAHEAGGQQKPDEPIPIPVYQEVDDDSAAEWKRPDYYIKFNEKTPAELDEIVEYEIDSEDEAFIASLKSVTAGASGGGGKRGGGVINVSEDKFEKCIDVLEKEAFRKIYKIPGRSFLDYIDFSEPPAKKHKQATSPTSNGTNQKITDLFNNMEKTKEVEDIPCCICNDGDYDDNNLIVFCDGCNLSVHQTCYGIPEIPEENWYCRRCTHFGKENQSVKCALCGHAGGALKPTVVKGGWAHVLCALWIPEATFLDASIMEPIDTTRISKARQGLECAVCGTREGMCIQCKSRQCYTAFHPFCAAQAGYVMEMTPNKSNTMTFKTYCELHSHELTAERERAKDNDLGDIVRRICSNDVKSGLQVLLQLPPNAIEALCQYWVSKKRKHTGVAINNILEGNTASVKSVNRPLIARLQMEEDAVLTAQRRRRHMQVGVELSLMRQLRCHLDRVRILLDVLKKRELWKREYAKVSIGILDALQEQINKRGYCDDISTYTPKELVYTNSPTPTPVQTAPQPKHTGGGGGGGGGGGDNAQKTLFGTPASKEATSDKKQDMYIRNNHQMTLDNFFRQSPQKAAIKFPTQTVRDDEDEDDGDEDDDYDDEYRNSSEESKEEFTGPEAKIKRKYTTRGVTHKHHAISPRKQSKKHSSEAISATGAGGDPGRCSTM